MMRDNGPDTQICQLFIRATPEQVWEVIHSPELARHYFFGSTLEIGDRFIARGPEGDLRVDGAVTASERPRLLAHEWRSMRKEQWAGEPASRVRWEIAGVDDAVSLLTVTHDHLEDSPETAASVRGLAWPIVLSGLKTLLETGEPLMDVVPG